VWGEGRLCAGWEELDGLGWMLKVLRELGMKGFRRIFSEEGGRGH